MIMCNNLLGCYKYAVPSIYVRAALNGDGMPDPDVSGQILSQMQLLAESAAKNAGLAEEYYIKIKAVSVKTPYIENGNWQIWNSDEEKFTDSGVSALGEKGENGNDGKSAYQI